MDAPPPQPPRVSRGDVGTEAISTRTLAASVVVVAVVVAIVAGVAWFGGGSASPSATPAASVAAAASSPTPTPSESVPGDTPAPAATLPAPTHLPGGPLASRGSILVLGADGTLSVVRANGRMGGLATNVERGFGFPAWSPDGKAIAAITGTAEGSEIGVFDPSQALTPTPDPPRPIFRSAAIGPFYLSWAPDSRTVSFLASQGDALSLRVAPADGSAPLDGSGAGSVIRTGSPLYYDWIGPQRLIAHIGTDVDAFLGEIDRSGASVSPVITSPGHFRTPVVSHDHAFVGYDLNAPDGLDQVVVARRDGTHRHGAKTLGLTAVAFDPAGDTLGFIGPDDPNLNTIGIPVGPLRVIDAASGSVRTLVDGHVVGFWWAPDGKTIAAIRVQPIAGATAPSPTPASPDPSASGAPGSEVRLIFVDVASGRVRSEPIVHLGQAFIDQVLTYFDQYSLSHHLWAPDGSSFALAIADADGTARVALIAPDGGTKATLPGIAAFWTR